MNKRWSPAEIRMTLGGIERTIKAPSRPQLLGTMKHLTYDDNFLFIREASKIKPINHVVDVGANIGSTAILFHLAFPDATILALEPSRANYVCLERNIESIPQITPLRVGAYSKKCQLELAMPNAEQRPDVVQRQSNGGLLSIYGKGEWEETIDVVRLDDVVTAPVDLLKIDVEGAEIAVLDGAKRILTEDRPIIIAELRPSNMKFAGYTRDDYTNYISNMGYEPMGNYLGDALLCPKELDRLAWKYRVVWKLAATAGSNWD